MKLLDILLLIQTTCLVVASIMVDVWFITIIPLFILFLFLSLRSSIVKRGMDIQNKMEELSRGKIWSLNVSSICSICDSPFEYEFDLATRTVECPHCNRINKLIVDIETIPN